MFTLLEQAIIKPTAVKEFNSEIALFYPGSFLPYALRAPLDSPIPKKEEKNAELIYDNGKLQISIYENRIYCVSDHTAVITLQNKESILQKAKMLESYFNEAAKTLSDWASHFYVYSLISKTAEFLGCLIDMNPTEDIAVPLRRTNENICDYSAIEAICAICLLYRRLSALRGVNFKLIFNKGIPSLVFSAKILASGIENIKDLPEYPALEDLDSNGGITIYTRLVRLAQEDDNELGRLTIALTMQAEDPSGILRAPEWKMQTRRSLDEADLDVPGRF